MLRCGFFSRINIFLVISILLIKNNVYTQRIYANVQQNHSGGLCIGLGSAGVDYPERAVDSPYTNYSILRTLLGLECYAQQNLQFTGANLPIETSPIVIKIGSSGSILSLLSNTSVQFTNSGTPTGTLYSSASLLGLLSVVGSDSSTYIISGETGIEKDGVMLKIGGLLSVATNARLYYAFFVVAPQVNDTSICMEDPGSIVLPISNFQTGTTYRMYASVDATVPVATSIAATITTPVFSMAGVRTYYMEAEEPGGYKSGREPIMIEVHEYPDTPPVELSFFD